MDDECSLDLESAGSCTRYKILHVVVWLPRPAHVRIHVHRLAIVRPMFAGGPGGCDCAIGEGVEVALPQACTNLIRAKRVDANVIINNVNTSTANNMHMHMRSYHHTT